MNWYEFLSFVLNLLGCEIYEDLSAVCWFGIFNVPW